MIWIKALLPEKLEQIYKTGKWKNPIIHADDAIHQLVYAAFFLTYTNEIKERLHLPITNAILTNLKTIIDETYNWLMQTGYEDEEINGCITVNKVYDYAKNLDVRKKDLQKLNAKVGLQLAKNPKILKCVSDHRLSLYEINLKYESYMDQERIEFNTVQHLDIAIDRYFLKPLADNSSGLTYVDSLNDLDERLPLYFSQQVQYRQPNERLEERLEEIIIKSINVLLLFTPQAMQLISKVNQWHAIQTQIPSISINIYFQPDFTEKTLPIGVEITDGRVEHLIPNLYATFIFGVKELTNAPVTNDIIGITIGKLWNNPGLYPEYIFDRIILNTKTKIQNNKSVLFEKTIIALAKFQPKNFNDYYDLLKPYVGQIINNL